jgi:cytochrome c
VDATTRFAVAKARLASSDCAGCHQRDQTSLGPSFVELADRYRSAPETVDALASKVRAGGSGVWGEAAMPAHPGLSVDEARSIVEYMLSAADTRVSVLPAEGRYTPDLPPGDASRGKLVIRAVYTDAPVGSLPAQTSEALTVLRAPVLSPAAADVLSNVSYGTRSSGEGQATRHTAITAMRDGYVGFRGLDLTGVTRLRLATSMGGGMGAAGGTIEVRSGGPAGAVLGQAAVAAPVGRGRGVAGGVASGTTIDLVPTSGLTDLYLVFRNDRVTGAQPLLSLSAVRLEWN